MKIDHIIRTYLSTLLVLIGCVLPNRSNAQIAGDVNGDGKISIADFTLVVDIMINDRYVESADLNGDGKVDENDLQQMDEEVLAPVVSTNSALATINGKEVQVEWIQLVENGPKWAVFNVGAEKVGQTGGTYRWDYEPTWGDNWRKPTSEELETLMQTEVTSVKNADTNINCALFENEAGEQLYFPVPKLTGVNYWSSSEEYVIPLNLQVLLWGSSLLFDYDSSGNLYVEPDQDPKSEKLYLRLVLNE